MLLIFQGHFLLVEVFYPLMFLVIIDMPGLLLLVYMIFFLVISLQFSFVNLLCYVDYVFFDFVPSGDLKVM